VNKFHVTISAKFADLANYHACNLQSLTFSYLDNGQPLSEEDQEKVDLIMGYYFEHDICPIFIPLERIVDDTQPFEAEALIELNKWTNEGLPRFNHRDIRTGASLGLPCGNGGGRPEGSKTALETSN
jgi:hypothetical protein